MTKKLCVLTALLLNFMLLFSACKKEEAISLYVELAAYRVQGEAVNNFDKKLREAFPQYADMNIKGSSLDDPGVAFQIVVFMFTNEVELFICDASASTKLAAQGDNFFALEDIFTEEEIATFKGKGVVFEKEDDWSNPTGEYSRVCGLDLSDSEAVVELTSLPNPQIFIVASTKNMEAAKEVFKYLATL